MGTVTALAPPEHFTITIGTHVNQPANLTSDDYTWRTFKGLFTKPCVSKHKRNGKYFLRTACQNSRNDENSADESSVLILDVDKGPDDTPAPDPKAVHAALRDMGIAHFLYTSYSHTDACPRYRVVIYSRPYTRTQLPGLVLYTLGELRKRGCAIKGVSENTAWAQPWFLPQIRSKDAGYLFLEPPTTDPGKPLDPEVVPRRDEVAPDAKEHSQPRSDGCTRASELIRAFNSRVEIGTLLHNYGYTLVSTGTINSQASSRWCPPGRDESATGGVVVYCTEAGKQVVYSHHDTDPLARETLDAETGTERKHAQDAFDVLQILGEHQSVGEALDVAVQCIPPDVLAEIDAHFPPDGGVSPEVVSRMEELNRRHFVATVNGKVRVYQHTQKIFGPDTFETVVAYTKPDFLLQYSNMLEFVRGKAVEVAPQWLKWDGRRQYSGLIFRPSCPEREYWPAGNATGLKYGVEFDRPKFNLWGGWPIPPAPGDWSRTRQHILEVWASTSADHFDYIMKWFAFNVQFPERKIGVSLVVRGPYGCGKGVISSGFLRLWGPHGLNIDRPDQLTKNFNAQFEYKKLAVLSEAAWAGDRHAEQVLKQVLTSTRLSLEKKGVDIEEIESFLGLIIESNEDWVVPASHGQRRFAVFNAAATWAKGYGKNELQRAAYFNALLDEQTQGGLAAWLHYLLLLDLTGFRPEEFPETDALAEQMEQTMPLMEKWLLSHLRAGTYPGTLSGRWPELGYALKVTPYLDELRFHKSRTHKLGQVQDPAKFGRELVRLLGGAPQASVLREVESKGLDYTASGGYGYDDVNRAKLSDRQPDGKVKVYRNWPGLEEARAAFKRATGADPWAGAEPEVGGEE